MSFWEQPKPTPQPKPWEQPAPGQTMVLDEQAMAELQEDPTVSVFEEEEEDLASLMLDANLRLEQGRLYQMVLQNDIFADTNADPRAIKNVQREIRNHAKERLETLLGIRQEQFKDQPTVVSSPFNDMEVTALKMIASKVTKGASENQQAGPQPAPPTPKKDGITSISGSLRPETTPILKPSAPAQKAVAKSQPKVTSKPSPKVEESNLKKSIDQMSQEELAAHDAAALERRSKNYAAKPQNLIPHPTAQQLEMLYTGMAQNGVIKLVPPNL